MRILSLFDGMSCGAIAFKQLGIDIDSYTAYEIDKFAVEVATHNFPEIIEKGDVFKGDFTEYEGVDYVIGGSPCFTAGHLILTDKGYVDVKDIKTGDMVLTHKGRYKPVIRTNERVSKVCEIKAMGYPTFTTTAEHPFYTLKRRKATYAEYKQHGSWRTFDKEPKWTAAKDLTNNHFVGMHIDKTEGAQSIDCETAYILGRYVADGHLRKTKRTGRKNSYQYQVVLSIGAEKVKQFKERVKYHHFSCYLHTDNVYRCVFSSQELLEFISSSGFGEGAANKNIPEMIHGQMPKVKEAFLMGYIEGDGCYIAKEDKYSMSTVSPRLAFGLQRLITSLWQTNVSVSVSNNNKPHKIGNREIKANYPLYTICAKREIRKQTVAHIQDGIMWTQVKSVRPTEREKTVYNIEVADDNSYTVNNCIVHNCTYWSIAQSPDKRETTASGIGWELFQQYVRAIKEAKPKYFIYENNKSMAKAIYDSISDAFGFEPIMINSALVSAQNRERYYWVGKRNSEGKYDKVRIEQPKDRGILLKDILITGDNLTNGQKAYALTASYDGTCAENTIERSQRTMVVEPINATLNNKAQTIRATCYKDGLRNLCGNDTEKKTAVAIKVMNYEQESVNNTDSGVQAMLDMPGSHIQNRRVLNRNEKSSTITASYDGACAWNTIERSQRTMIAEPVNTQNRTVCINSKDKNGKQPQQNERVYNPEAKAVTVTSGWMPQTLIRVMDRELESVKNADSGIIAIVEGKEHEQIRRGRKMQDKANAVKTTNEFYQLMGNVKLHKVENGQIEIKGKKYPIKLKDGYYVIRKLTVRECARLQTIPEWYEFQWAEHYEQQFGKEVDICNYAKLKAAINLLQTEKLNSAININCDLFGMVQQNSQGQLLTIQKNAKQKDATGNSKQLSVTVYCTTKDGNENSQLTKQKCALYVENRWDTTDATKCAVSIISNGYSTETLYITKNENLSLMEILNVNTSKQMTEDGFIELLRRRYLEENSMQKKLYIISTLTNWIILRTIYMCATIKPTWLSIDSLNDWQHHSLTKDLLSLKMGTMSGLSNSSSYKCIGNGWTIEVIMHLIRATQEGKIEPKQLTFWEV